MKYPATAAIAMMTRMPAQLGMPFFMVTGTRAASSAASFARSGVGGGGAALTGAGGGDALTGPGGVAPPGFGGGAVTGRAAAGGGGEAGTRGGVARPRGGVGGLHRAPARGGRRLPAPPTRTSARA